MWGQVKCNRLWVQRFRVLGSEVEDSEVQVSGFRGSEVTFIG